MEVSWPRGRNKSMKRMVGSGMLVDRREVLSLHSVAYAEDGAAVWLTYKLLEAGDVVYARGFGKFELSEVGGPTRKGRVSIVLRVYV